MAAKKISQSAPDLQAITSYLLRTSDISRDNFLLRQLHSGAEFRRELSRLCEAWVMARAQEVIVEMIRASQKRPRSVLETATQVEGDLVVQVARPRTPAPSDVTALDPFFRSREEANGIRRTQTPSQRNRWALYYGRYGCLLCGAKDQLYDSDGMCHRCRMRILHRLSRLDGKEKRLISAAG